MGSVKAFTSIGDMLETWETRYELHEALKITEMTTGKKVDHLVPFELGGTNTTVMLSLANRAGITSVDGDGLGRSAPETQMITFVGYGISLCPMPVVTKGGSVVIVQETTSPALADDIGRSGLERGARGRVRRLHRSRFRAGTRRSAGPRRLCGLEQRRVVPRRARRAIAAQVG